MTLVSYAQNHEDIMLWRALKNVENGFYVDVGASDPYEDSVTQLFYDNGWCGINIEPSPKSYESLCKERVRDINLCCAVGSHEGKITFYDVPTRGWSTSDPEVGKFRLADQDSINVSMVDIFYLDTILETHLRNKTIHFLKIDVEGAEQSVLQGLNLSRFRPWILLIEAISPITQAPSYQQWESSVLNSGYQFIHFDGLNRFYLADEHHENLRHAFTSPPNVLDQFSPSSLVYWHTQAQKLQARSEQAEAQSQELQTQLQESKISTQQLQEEVQELQTQLQESKISPQRFQRQIKQLKAQIQKFQDKSQTSEQYVQQMGRENRHLKTLIAHRESQILTLKDELRVFSTSKSWRWTSPLRAVGLVFRKLNRVRHKVIDHSRNKTPKQIISLISQKSLEKSRVLIKRYFVRQTPHLSSYRYSPTVATHLSQSFNTTPFALPLPAGQRVVYLFVDHTVACPTNTGVQRVTRALASALICLGECVRYIKWDSNHEQAVLINLSERKELARWNGPDLTHEDREIYPNPNQAQIAIEPRPIGENHWLIVPEVPHITFHDRPVTLDLIMWARRTHLKIGFIFYDAIPLQRQEFADMADKHERYMQQILLADIVWPISNWAARDLIQFWRERVSADDVTMPEVNPLPLSGESSLRERIQTPTDNQSESILSVGTIEPRKNQVALIHAFQDYCDQNPNTNWTLTLVGNLHPAVAQAVTQALTENPRIQHLGHITDKQLDQLYQTCAFTAFPSTCEGFGLPIIESLWYGKPCICANFGSMVEVAEGGGCLTVDTRDQNSLTKALFQLIENQALQSKLTVEAINRPIRTWDEYANLVATDIEKFRQPVTQLGYIYYWIESTLQFPKNTGIQRVSRQLARGLIDQGLRLIPVCWDEVKRQLVPASQKDLSFFSQWNGPKIELWQNWVDPHLQHNSNCWFLMAELPLNRSAAERQNIQTYIHSTNLKSASIFYDAIPWLMRDIYPTPFSQAHREYMLELNSYDIVLPISESSRCDLISFLGSHLSKPQSLESQIQTVLLPGEFPESDRHFQSSLLDSKTVTVLCVGTVEPRKNHEAFLDAFRLAMQSSTIKLNLILAGGSHSIEPDLGKRVRAVVDQYANITWEEEADDTRLRQLHLDCDFTVYPSIKEGFGLPILESLWYAKPCICANFGAMREVAEGGGCLMVDVRDVEALAQAIQSLAEDKDLYQRLTQEISQRSFKSWQDYSHEVALHLAKATPQTKKELSLSSLVKGKEETSSQSNSIQMQDTHPVYNLSPRPLLSVCISTYNRAEWLSVALRNWSSLYPNPLPEVELVVCDNASTDHTRDVVRPYLSRSDFSYHRNEQNVGMLGNLRQTAHYAYGQYIWILGDDDLLIPGSIERVIATLKNYPKVSLVYLNYSFTRIEDARTVSNFDTFFQEATPIVPAENDLVGPIHTICAQNENFFTAIYTLVFRRDHALRAYSQNTSGRPFSTMLTCIPTTYYVLNNMMNESGVWIGSPQVVVNMNVSWMKYAPLWILERIPEVYEEAERHGAAGDDIDRWRSHTLPGVLNYFREIFEDDPLDNSKYFSPSRLMRRFKHLPDFQRLKPQFYEIYARAHANYHPAAQEPMSQVFPEPSP